MDNYIKIILTFEIEEKLVIVHTQHLLGTKSYYIYIITMNQKININAPVHNLTIVNDNQDKAKELEKEKQREEQVGKYLLKVLNYSVDL